MTAVEQKWVFRSLRCTLCQFTCLCATYRLYRPREGRREEPLQRKEGGESGGGGEQPTVFAVFQFAKCDIRILHISHTVQRRSWRMAGG